MNLIGLNYVVHTLESFVCRLLMQTDIPIKSNQKEEGTSSSPLLITRSEKTECREMRLKILTLLWTSDTPKPDAPSLQTNRL